MLLRASFLTMALSLWSFSRASQINAKDELASEKLRGQEEETVAARQKRSDDLQAWEPVTSAQAQRIASLEAQLTAAQTRLTSIEIARGVTYIHWGRSQCPVNAELVYNGYVGASKYNEQGGGANRLCLTHTPAFDEATPLNGFFSLIHGTEWYVPGHDHTEVPCAVCRVPDVTSVLMVPGTNACPPGWATQYKGHITAMSNRYVNMAEFLCTDGNPEDREGNGPDGEGGHFMYSVAACGTLPCPPYVNGKVVTCVVCAK